MRYLISNFFQLVVGVSSKLILDIINKSLRISKVFSEKSFELRLCNQNGTFLTTCVLNLFNSDGIIEK